MTKNTFLAPAICRVFCLPLSELMEILPVTDGFHFQVLLNPGKSWKEIYFTPGSAELGEKPKETEAGVLYEQTLRILFPGDGDANLAQLEQLQDRPLLIRIELSSGQTHLMGSAENGARLSRTLQLSAKATASQLEFSCQATTPMGWLLM